MSYEDTSEQALSGEYLSRVIDEYLDVVFELNPSLKKPTEAQIQKIREKVINDLQAKYPNAGIVLTRK